MSPEKNIRSPEKTIRIVANRFSNGNVKRLPVELVEALRSGTITANAFFHSVAEGKGGGKFRHAGSFHERRQECKKKRKSRPNSGPKRSRLYR